MSVLDVFLILLGGVAVLWGAYRQFLGSLLSLLGLYMTLLVAGTVASLFGGAYGFGTEIVRSLWGEPGSIRLVEVGLFTVVGMGVFVALEVGNRIVFPHPSLPRLGLWDGLLGGLLGLVLSVALMAVVGNLWRQIALTSWRPYDLWIWVRHAHETSLVMPYVDPVLESVRGVLFPFALTGYPRVLMP